MSTATSFASVYPRYVAKVEKKGRSKAELGQVTQWADRFDESVRLGRPPGRGYDVRGILRLCLPQPACVVVTGRVCGVHVENELAKGKSMDKVLRA